jgi:hypothetical protein
VGNPGVVYQDVDSITLEDIFENHLHILAVGDVAAISFGVASLSDDLASQGLSSGLVNVQNANAGSARGKSFRDGTANTTGATGNYGYFTVETKSVEFSFQKNIPPTVEGNTSLRLHIYCACAV